MNFTKKEQRVIIIVVCFIALLSFFKIYKSNINDDIVEKEELDYNKELTEDEEEIEEVATAEKEEAYIVIHLAGSVKNPGILELEQGSRVIDAIELSGGLNEDANIDSINLARKLNDEEKIYIPKEGEEVVDTDNTIDNDLVSETSNGSRLIDINLATKEELITLPGIGDKTADKILNYREDSLFKTIEDIKNVSGIGEKKFEAIKDLIKVN